MPAFAVAQGIADTAGTTAEVVPADTPHDDEARIRFEAGELAYADGRFEDALHDFQRAFELSRRTDLLYNVGLSHERLRQDAEAIDAFERFLAASPDHAHADVVRRRLTRLRGVEANASGETEAATESPSRVGLILTACFGGAAVVGGAVLLGIALSDKAEIEGLSSPRFWGDIEGQVDSVPRRSAAGIALIAVGGAAVLGAVLWRVLGGSDSTVVSVGPSQVSLRQTF